MYSILFSLLLLGLISGCATSSSKSKVEVTSNSAIIKKVPKKALFSKRYVKVISFVSANQRQLISQIVDGRGKYLRDYGRVLGVRSEQYSTFKRILKQNLPKLIQYNEPDAFQARVQELLIDKRIQLSAIRPQIR